VWFVVVIAAALAIAVLVGNRSSTSPPAAKPTTLAADIGSPGSSTVWFCPGLPAAVAARDTVVSFTNLDTATRTVAITVLVDGAKPVHTTVPVAGLSVVTKKRASIGPPGALTIETFGARVVVEEGVDGGSGLELASCATHTSTEWYFAAGTTLRGIQQWLVIEDPYAADAKVDVTIFTDQGARHPERVQSLDIARRSRVVLPLHDIAVLQGHVAVQVSARVGTVVAAQALVFSAAAGTPGVAYSIGAPAASDVWLFADGTATASTDAWVAVVNVGGEDTSVEIDAAPSGKTVVPAANVDLAADDVVWVKLGRCAPTEEECVAVPDGVRYALSVKSERHVKVVAQVLARHGNNADRRGVTASFGATAAQKSWVFGRSQVAGERSTQLSFSNGLAAATEVSVSLLHDGRTDKPAKLQGIAVPGGGRVTVTVPGPSDAGIVVDASTPVVVERSILGADDTSRNVGIVAG
jgi:hypothetical protein